MISSKGSGTKPRSKRSRLPSASQKLTNKIRMIRVTNPLNFAPRAGPKGLSKRATQDNPMLLLGTLK